MTPRFPAPLLHASTARPARIVGVCQLLLNVLEDLTDCPPETLDNSEGRLAEVMIPLRADLQSILDQARTEMSQLAPAVLAT